MVTTYWWWGFISVPGVLGNVERVDGNEIYVGVRTTHLPIQNPGGLPMLNNNNVGIGTMGKEDSFISEFAVELAAIRSFLGEPDEVEAGSQAVTLWYGPFFKDRGSLWITVMEDRCRWTKERVNLTGCYIVEGPLSKLLTTISEPAFLKRQIDLTRRYVKRHGRG